MPPDACQSVKTPLTSVRNAITTTISATCTRYAVLCTIVCPSTPSFRLLYQIPGTIANFFALYFPPSSFLYLRSFFLAQSAI